jgi:arsenite methyltransferase
LTVALPHPKFYYQMVSRGGWFATLMSVDFSPEMVRLCEKRFEAHIRAGRLDLCCADASRLPHADGEFTKTCSVNTIYFWPDPMAVLAELRRVLCPGGKLVICFNPRVTASKMPFTRRGFLLYEGPEVRRLLEKAGFREVTLVCARHRIGEFQATTGIK